jgi:hypothetical protein
MFITLVGSIAELERSLIVERIRQGCEGHEWRDSGLAVRLSISTSMRSSVIAWPEYR